MASRPEIRLFGAFRATAGSAPIPDLTAPRTQTLLAFLILHADTPQSRQHLAYVLWPDSTERQARTNLRKVIHQLRNTLPAAGDSLLVTRATIQWNPDAPYCVDVLELDRLLARLDDDPQDTDVLQRVGDLYAEELLPGCYDDWIAPLRAGVAGATVGGAPRLRAGHPLCAQTARIGPAGRDDMPAVDASARAKRGPARCAAHLPGVRRHPPARTGRRPQ